MKNFVNRGLSLLLALAMCLSLLAGISVPASAASYTYNWGQRGTVAEELSDAAVAWYNKYNVEYSDLAQLSGSSSTSSVPSSSLYLELKDLMTTAHSTKTSYDGTKSMYQYTDCQNGGGMISSFYSGKSIGPGWGEGGSWNREHTWPNSKGLGGQDENDIMMLRPTATSENSSRGNTAYGEGSSYYDPNDVSGGTYNLHGDVARIVLYVYTRWGNTSYMWGTSGVMESKDVLLKWMEEDPVDTWELGRNDAVASITGTRNVYVDYPELGFLLFNEDVPAGYTTPSGEGNATSYTITAYSNNSTYGTVSLSGKVITATPKTGYYVSGYTVTSGSAAVTQSGNTFRVSPESDCSVMINFAPKTAVTMTFMENGTVGSTMSSYGGDTVTLPANTQAAPEGYTFLGWTDAEVSDTTVKPAIYAAGTSCTASNKTYYALYTYSVGGTGVTEYVLKDLADIKAGDVFVITSATSSTVYALPNGTIGKGPEGVTVTVSGDKLSTEPDASLLWNLGGSTNAWEFYPDGVTGRWLACTNDNNGVSVGTDSNKTFQLKSGYLYNTGTGRYMGVYVTNPDWRCYTTSGGNIANQTLGFYVKTESGTAYYTTTTFVCEHEDTTNVAAVEATCSQTGFTAGVYCNDCEKYISGHEVTPMTDHENIREIPAVAPTCSATGLTSGIFCDDCQQVVVEQEVVAANGHNYTGVVTAPTETEQGYTTYTCSACGDSYVSDYTDALGETFYVSFIVPDGVSGINTMTCNKDGITLPVAGAPDGYTFLGWTTAAVEDTETKPEVLTGSYNASANITLYALYSYVESDGAQVSNTYTLYSGEITEGDYVIVDSAEALVAADANDNDRMDAQSVTITNDTISSPDGSIIWHIAPTDDGYYTIYNAANGVYAAGNGSKNKSALISNVTDYAKWTPSGTETYEFKNLGNTNKGVNSLLRKNSTSIGWGCYSSSTGGAVSLYKGYTGVTYYTTLTTPAAEIYENGQMVESYAGIEAAYAACGEDQYIRLLDNAEVELQLTKDLYIDLNGYCVEGIIDTGDYKIYGMDSATNEYGSSDGYMDCTNADGSALELDMIFRTTSALTGDIRSYMAIEGDNGWTFNRYYLGVQTITLKTGTSGIGYKAAFYGNQAVCDQLNADKTFGFTLSLEGGNTVTRSLNGITSGRVVTLRIDNYDVANFGTAELTAQVSVTMADGSQLTSAVAATSMKQVIETLNADTTLTDIELAAVSAYVEANYEAMKDWAIGNLYTK